MITLNVECGHRHHAPDYTEQAVVVCRFCERWDNEQVPATHLGGQWEGGDENVDPVWVPICAFHASRFYDLDLWNPDGMPVDQRLPLIDLDVKQAQVVTPPKVRDTIATRHTSLRQHIPGLSA